MNAGSEKEQEDLSYLSTLESRPMTSEWAQAARNKRPGNYPKKELYVCWERVASNGF